MRNISVPSAVVCMANHNSKLLQGLVPYYGIVMEGGKLLNQK
jgi:hypothetical protein